MHRRPMPLLSVQPSRGLVDERFTVLARNLPPLHELTLHALHRSEDGDDWEAFGHYTSDATGTVNVSRDVCTGGTYDGMEPMGLIWSMRPVPGSRSGLRFRKKDVTTPVVLTVSLHQGSLTEGFGQQVALASVLVERWYQAPGVTSLRTSLKESGVQGALFLPPGVGPFPVVLDLWGGGGGMVAYRSALLASHGFASLALEYIGLRDEDGGEVVVEDPYFEAALEFLKQHPLVAEDRLALMGFSFGCGVVLRLSAYSSAIKPSCVISVSGSHVQPVGASTSIQDMFVAYKRNDHKTRFDQQNRVIWRDLLLPIPSDPGQKVDVGRLSCPLMLVVAEDDHNWPAVESAQDMKEMMDRAGNGHLLTVLSYPKAGHLIEQPYSPHTAASMFTPRNKVKYMVLWGGETAAHAHAQEDSWRKTLAFLKEHLYHTCNTHTCTTPVTHTPDTCTTHT